MTRSSNQALLSGSLHSDSAERPGVCYCCWRSALQLSHYLFTERPQSADHAQPIWRRGVRERDLHLASALQLCSRVPAPTVLLLVCLSISGVTGHLLPRKAPTSHHQFLTQPSSWLWKPKSWWRGCVRSQLIKVQSSLTQNKKPEHCVHTLRGNTMFGRKDKGSNCKHFQIM